VCPPQDAVVLALDLGGTQIRAAAIPPSGERFGRRALATPHAGGAEAIYAACAELLIGVRADLPADLRDHLVAIGISSMGPVDPWRGLVVDPPNVVALRDAPLADEHWLGAARGCLDFMYITVSTGLGGSIFREGRLMLGPDGVAGEIGHVCLMLEGGPNCGCGGSGCLEAIVSGSGLATAARQALAEAAGEVRGSGADGLPPGGSAFLAKRATAARLTGRDVAEGELAGDRLCTALMERSRRAFAIACVGWVNAFNPERIVVGGAVADGQGERLLGPARDEVSRTAFPDPAARVEIVPAELGNDVGLVGAWPLVAERHGDPAWRRLREKR
jgi:glucokinase